MPTGPHIFHPYSIGTVSIWIMPVNLCYETNVSDWHMWKTIQNSQYPFLLMLFARKMHPVLSIRIFCNVDLNNMFLSKYVVNVNITKDTKVGVIVMKYIYTNLTCDYLKSGQHFLNLIFHFMFNESMHILKQIVDIQIFKLVIQKYSKYILKR